MVLAHLLELLSGCRVPSLKDTELEGKGGKELDERKLARHPDNKPSEAQPGRKIKPRILKEWQTRLQKVTAFLSQETGEAPVSWLELSDGNEAATQEFLRCAFSHYTAENWCGEEGKASSSSGYAVLRESVCKWVRFHITATKFPDLPLASMPASAPPSQVLATGVFFDGRVMLAVLHSLCPDEVRYAPTTDMMRNWDTALHSARDVLGVHMLTDAAHMAKGTGFWEDANGMLLVMYLAEVMHRASVKLVTSPPPPHGPAPTSTGAGTAAGQAAAANGSGAGAGAGAGAASAETLANLESLKQKEKEYKIEIAHLKSGIQCTVQWVEH